MGTSDTLRDPIDIHVGAQLKSLRTQSHMTQAGLAKALGITFQQVQKYEKGSNRMAASTLAKAAAALGCRVSDFYPSDEGEDRTPKIEDAVAELTAIYERVGPRQRDALLVVARALLDIRR